MSIIDNAWKAIKARKHCRNCGEKATKWTGGTYYCDQCYENIIVLKIEKLTPSPPKKEEKKKIRKKRHAK
jgi:predicted ATP-dependent serine protease